MRACFLQTYLDSTKSTKLHSAPKKSTVLASCVQTERTKLEVSLLENDNQMLLK